MALLGASWGAVAGAACSPLVARKMEVTLRTRRAVGVAGLRQASALRNLPLLVIHGCILRDCLWLQRAILLELLAGQKAVLERLEDLEKKIAVSEEGRMSML